ncbi:MAG: GspE/PulE family protein [Isosphaeraceae bacterium]
MIGEAPLPLVVQLLIDRGAIEPARLRELRTKHLEIEPEHLIESGVATELEIAQLYADHLGLAVYETAEDIEAFDPGLKRILPEQLCRDQTIVPLKIAEGADLEIAFASPDELLIVDEIQLLTGMRVIPSIARKSLIEARIEKIFDSQNFGVIAGASPFGDAMEVDAEDDEEGDDGGGLLNLDAAPPPGRAGRIIRMVNQVLDQAMRSGASDIHLEPFEDNCKLRLRIDGRLQELPPLSRGQFLKVVSRLKILARMDIAEKRLPQDGSIAVKSGDKRIDLRVNTVPTVHGEKMVMRLLDKSAIPLELGLLGFDKRQTTDLTASIHMPHGLMLVTGPTGSGKSTTLYTCLNLLNESHSNICTVEDPVEYKFKGMNQVQVKAQIGLNFASALRAFLRQDPDIIMVGEVRDQETAGICLRAALTGHFVLSTIHTNDALSAVTRLGDMGVEPFLLSCTLRVVEAQRLVRRLCSNCKESYTIDDVTADRYKIAPGTTLYKPVGCDRCRLTGYRGRAGIFEVIRITPPMAALIQKRATLGEMREAARAQGMKLLIDSAIDKACQGLTSLEVALSTAMSEEE